MQRGFGIIEIIVAMGIFIIIAVTAVTTVVGSFSVNRLGDEETQAYLYAQEGIEVVRSIKNQDWTNLSPGTYGLDSSGGSWAFSGNSETSGPFTRQITLAQSQRDDNGNIVESGGTADADTYQVTSTVTWDFTPTRNNTVELTTYLTQWEKVLCNWITAHQEANHDRAGNANPNDIAVDGNYAYLVNNTQGGSDNEFYLVSLSNLASISSVGEEIGDNVNGVAVYGDYAYIVTSGTTEVRVVDISNKADPQLLTSPSYDLEGGQNANKIAVDANYIYLVRQNRGSNGGPEDAEFQILNRSDLTYVGGYEIGNNATNLYIDGNHAYVTSSDNSNELWELNIANPASVALIGTYDAQDGPNGLSVYANGTDVYLTTSNNSGSASGEADGEFYILTTDHTGSSPFTYVDHYDVGNSVWDVQVIGSYALLATGLNNQEFMVLDISNPSSLSQLTAVDLDGDAFALGFSQTACTTYIASANNSQELQVMYPGGGGGSSESQADQLSVDTSAATIGGPSDRQLQGMTLTNTGGSIITITSIDISWDIAQNIDRVRIDGSNLWTGSAPSPASLDITDHDMAGGVIDDINHFRFADDMTGTTFNIDFNMSDGSTESVTGLTPPDG